MTKKKVQIEKGETSNNVGGGNFNASVNSKILEDNANLSKQNQRLIAENDILEDELENGYRKFADLEKRFRNLLKQRNQLYDVAKGKPEVNARQTCFFNAEENGNLFAEINKLKDENAFLTDKVESLHRVVSRQRESNAKLCDKIKLDKTLPPHIEFPWIPNVVMTPANYKKLRDKITELESVNSDLVHRNEMLVHQKTESENVELRKEAADLRLAIKIWQCASGGKPAETFDDVVRRNKYYCRRQNGKKHNAR